MIGVHLGNQQRHVRVHPVVARVADDDVAGLRERALDLAGDRRIEAGEHQLRRACPAPRRSTCSPATSSGSGVGSRHAAASRYALPADRSLAPSHVDLEPRMVREQRDELLADHPGRAENPDFDRHRRSVLCAFVSSVLVSVIKKKADAV